MVSSSKLTRLLALYWLLAGAAVLPAQDIASTSAARSVSAPSPAEVLGHDLGERFTDHAGVIRYMDALASVSPRVEVRPYGETVEGRALVQVLIAREDHLARLDEILALNRELADPETGEARAREIAASNPAVVYFSYGVHGNESSSSEAAMWTAWDLVRDAEAVAGVLDSVVVVIDPVTNPDGRDRYVNWYRQARGVAPNPNPNAREHWEPWPGGRFNHYLFDLNRDWTWMSQPETRARLATWRHWTPQVHVDFHEMSWTSSYFFFPAAEPISPMYPEHTLRWGQYFGEANAAALEARGEAFYTAESFDLFYPGYGDSWPSLVGAIGMTYEQAGHSRAGLAIERPDGTVLTLRNRAENHRATGQATLRTVARRKSELLLGFAEFHRTTGVGADDVLLVPGRDAGRIEALVALLRDQGIEVERAGRAFRANTRAYQGFADRREFPAGTFRVRARQPRGRLAMTLLQPEIRLDATYSYDVSAWSLPFAYGVEAHQADRVPGAEWQPVREPLRVVAAEASVEDGRAPYGFLVAPEFASWPGLVRFLEQDGRARVLQKPFTLEGRSWPAGTILLPSFLNDALVEKVAASGLGERAVPVHRGMVERGNDLGTGSAYDIRLPRVAVLMGDGVSATSYGAHWFFLEQTLGMPFDAVPVDRLGAVDLDTYDVIVLPDMNRSALNDSRAQLLEGWVRRGGTLVAVAGGARIAADAIADIELRQDARASDDDERLERALRGREARQLERWEQNVPGAILSVRLDPAHPLAYGVGIDGDDSSLFVLHSSGTSFEPDERFESVAYFPDGLQKVSGVINDRVLERLSRSTWLATRNVGRGKTILFADDPLFRHFWYAGFLPYVNALIVGPGL